MPSWNRPMVFVALLASAFAAGGCSSSTPSSACATRADCADGERCIDRRCTPDEGGGDGGTDAGRDAGRDAGPTEDAGGDAGDCPADRRCSASCCAEGERCRFDSCVPDLGTCGSSDDCSFDSYCDDGECIPYGVPEGHDRDESCTRAIDIEALVPAVQCRWTGPPADDPAPSRVHVMATPIVVDLDLDEDPDTLRPSIVFPAFPTSGSYHEPGVLRVIDGASCEQQFTVASPEIMSPAPVAAGDLDGDGRAEIVAAAHAGGVIAFGYDAASDSFGQVWRSGTCDGSGGRTPDATGGTDQWSGPSIHDLDDDGAPEVIYGGTVYGADGCIRSSTLGFPGYHKGVVPVVADVDEDGAMELVFGNGIYEWDAGAGDFVAESYFDGTGLGHGQVAVADLGDFPLSSMGDADAAEVVVVASGAARVQTLEGDVVFGPVSIPGGGTGGPPTIADFDGDGRREFATAGGSQYVVLDLDCTTGGDPAGCNGESRTTGILWTQPSQDASSNVTGSSVFDFDADGSAEAVYADECYLRIYDGATGEVRYSAARSSGTTYENPVIADVDGDFHSEIVSAVNDYSGITCPATDPLRSSTSYARNHGIVVLRDESDRWAASRPVWSQHAYAVTHVGDQGEIPRTSAVDVNWRDPELNNFRQNVQGELEALGVADLTSDGEREEQRLVCTDGTATLEARMCNRGTLPVGAGKEVAFREGAEDGPELCRASLATPVAPGECADVSCDAPLSAEATEPVQVYVVADPEDGERECLEGNNAAVLLVSCTSVE